MSSLLPLDILFLLIAFSKESDLDDKNVSIAIRNGNHDVFKSFYKKHYSALYRFMISRGMSHDEAEDLVQKAFIKIWDMRDGIDESKSLRAYLFQIAYSRMLNHIEYQSKFNDVEFPDNRTSDANPKQDVDHSELLSLIKKKISVMPDKRGMVFELCFMKEFTYKEAAQTMNVSVKTIENHMALAFKDIRQSLIEWYGEDVLKQWKKT